MVTVREVEAHNVHAGIEHLNEHVHVPAGRPKKSKRLLCVPHGADDLRLSVLKVDRIKNLVELHSRVAISLFHSRQEMYLFKLLK